MLTNVAHAQKAAEAVKPALSPSQAVLVQWNDIGRKLIAMAEDFPEDKYDFKPTPAQRSFAEQLLHASGDNYYFTNVLLGEKLPTTEDPPRDQFKSNADVVAFVKKSFADGAAAIQKRGDKGMSELVVDPYSHRQTRIDERPVKPAARIVAHDHSQRVRGVALHRVRGRRRRQYEDLLLV